MPVYSENGALAPGNGELENQEAVGAAIDQTMDMMVSMACFCQYQTGFYFLFLS